MSTMSEQEEKLMQERVLAYHEREQDAETRYRKLKEFLSINGYNVAHLLKLDEGKLLIEHAEACRDSFKICMKNRDNEITDLRSRLADAQARAEWAEGALASVLGQDQTYSLSSVLKEFVTVTNHLFDVHSCDHHGYEIWMQARDKAEHYLRTITNVLTPAPQGRTDGERVVQCDQRTFPTAQDAALHLLWVIQRLSFYEKEREGQPCDGFRIRQCIIEARKLLDSIGYESTVFGNADATAPEVKGGGE
jgi:hypothetical protein